MSQYNPVTPTLQGQAMIAESLRTEEGLVFTKVEWGDGIVSRGEQYPTFTALKNKVIESPISKMERQDATLYITSVVNNSTLSTGFYCREIGVWAKIGANGTEQLFAYTYAENASYTPSSNQYNEKRIRIGLGVDANVNVTIKFNSEVYLTRQELEDHDADSAAHDAAFTAHNADTDAHPDIRQKLNTNASNITALQTSDNAKFKAVSVSNDTLTFTKGDNTTTAVTVNNVANATNADKLDGFHENSFLRYRGRTATNGEDTLWSQIGIKEYDDCLPEGVKGTYTYGGVVSLPAVGPRLDIWYNHHSSYNGDGLWYRTGWESSKYTWAVLLDSANYNKYAPTKTGTGASGTWGINISGTATKATQDGNGANIADTYLKKSGDTVTGTLNVPTQAITDNSTKVANTAFVQSAVDSKVSKLVNSAPETLDTINELANALGDDPNFATTVATQIGTKADRTELNNKLALHNADANAHDDIRAKITSDINSHNSDATAHAAIMESLKWKKLYSTKFSTFVPPANGAAVCDIPSTWKELHVTWAWGAGSNQVLTYTTNVINESTEDQIIFTIPPNSEGMFSVNNNKLYIQSRGAGNDGTPVLVMWR